VPTFFSIIIPAYNSESTLLSTVKSVQAQAYSDYEIIIVNDGSLDGTATVIDALVLDSRIRAVFQTNAGVSAARNAGAKVANGEWLIFLDSDDLLAKRALELFSQFATTSETPILRGGFIRKVGCTQLVVIPDGRRYVAPLAGSFAIRRGVFTGLEGYDVRLKFSENSELFHRLSIAGFKMFFINDVIFTYNESRGGGSKNLNNSTESLELILSKHTNSLSRNTKFLYNRILGVNYCRRRDFVKSRGYFWKAYVHKPWEFTTMIRYGITFFPILAQKIYKTTV
jgi:glycosyltransferase involved in cell wall biosynthesis